MERPIARQSVRVPTPDQYLGGDSEPNRAGDGRGPTRAPRNCVPGLAVFGEARTHREPLSEHPRRGRQHGLWEVKSEGWRTQDPRGNDWVVGHPSVPGRGNRTLPNRRVPPSGTEIRECLWWTLGRWRNALGVNVGHGELPRDCCRLVGCCRVKPGASSLSGKRCQVGRPPCDRCSRFHGRALLETSLDGRLAVAAVPVRFR